MGLKFTLENNNIQNSKVGHDIHGGFGLDEITIRGNTIIDSDVLTQIDIPTFCNESSQASYCMTESEYRSFQKLLTVQNNKHRFINVLCDHLINFGEGVLASIVANKLT